MAEKVIKFEETTTESQEDFIYRLEEMCDAIEASITNASNVLVEQKALLDIMENIEESNHDWHNFIEGIKSQSDDINEQIKTLTYRKSKLEAACASAKLSDDTKLAINLLIEGLGIFANRG